MSSHSTSFDPSLLAEARDPATPVERLVALAVPDADPALLVALAENPSLPLSLLRDLAAHDDERVRRTIAEREDTPPALLPSLHRYEQFWVDLAIVLNINTRARDLDGLAWSYHLRWEIYSHPNVAPSTLAKLRTWDHYGDDDELEQRLATRRSAMQAATRPEALARLARDPDPDVRWKVASNPLTPAAALALLANDEDDGIRARVAELLEQPAEDLRAPNTTEESTPPEILLARAQQTVDVLEWFTILDSPTAPLEALTLLVERATSLRLSERGVVRAAPPDLVAELLAMLARHPAISAELLTLLGNNAVEAARREVAGNPKTPRAVLMRLANDESLKVRVAVAQNAATPSDTLFDIARDSLARERRNLEAVAPELVAEAALVRRTPGEEYETRVALAQNPAAPAELLMHLAQDTHGAVCRQVAEHPQAPQQALEQIAFAKDRYPYIAVAANPATPAHVLRRLAEIGDRKVQATLATNPSSTAEVLSLLAHAQLHNEPTLTVSAELQRRIKTTIDRHCWSGEPNLPHTLRYNYLAPPELCEQERGDYDALKNALADRCLGAVHPNLSAEMLRTLAEDPYLRGLAVTHANSDDATIARFANDESPWLRGLFALQERAGSDALSLLADDPHPLVRYAVANNPKTPLGIVDRLRADSRGFVREAAELAWFARQ